MTGAHSRPTQVTAPSSFLCVTPQEERHHGGSPAIRTGMVPDCLSAEGEPLSHKRGRVLGFEVVVSLAHCEPPFLAPKEKQKLG